MLSVIFFFNFEQPKRLYMFMSGALCGAIDYLPNKIFIRFLSKLYRLIAGIPMDNTCAPLVADLFLFCYERDFMLSLSDINRANVIEASTSISRYLDDLLNIDNPYFKQMVSHYIPQNFS